MATENTEDKSTKKTPEPPKVPEPEPESKTEDKKDDKEPNWINERLAQAKRSRDREILEQYGVKDFEELEAKLTKLEELELDKLTDSEKKDKQINDLKESASKSEVLQKNFDQMVAKQLEKLPEEQRNKILERAGNDTVKQYELLELVSEFAGNAPANPSPKPAATPKGEPPPKPGGALKNAAEIFEELQKTDKTGIRASLYYRQNSHAINAAREAASS